jgi:hypothetical protein
VRSVRLESLTYGKRSLELALAPAAVDGSLRICIHAASVADMAGQIHVGALDGT